MKKFQDVQIIYILNGIEWRIIYLGKIENLGKIVIKIKKDNYHI